MLNEPITSGPLPEQLLNEASAAVLGIKTRWVGLIVRGEEQRYHFGDAASFERALLQLRNAGTPVTEEHRLLTYLWATIGIGLLAIILLQHLQ